MEERMHELLKHRNDKEIHTTNLFEEIETLLEENKKQKEVINNAIEYVEHRIVEDDYILSVDTNMVQKELLDILKEVSE